MLTLMFIEDEPDNIRPVQGLIEERESDIKCQVFSFSDAKEKILSTRPQIIILDLLRNGATSEPEREGLDIYDLIWKKHFCPLIVYSAQPEIVEDQYPAHPFIKCVKKGSGSQEDVLNALRELRPHIDALKEAEEHIRDSFSRAMRDVAPLAFVAVKEEIRRNDIIKRSGRRRLAALMDALSGNEPPLASWEQYLCPPISDNILLGEILKKADIQEETPSSFRIVLTPSCDMVNSGNRTPKVTSILVAKCCSIEEGLDKANLKGVRNHRLQTRILNPGYCGSIIPLPRLEGRIPTMAADLRDLEHISIDEIALTGKLFDRVASIDSPFRELVAWAYLQIAGRPGLPERDTNSWAEEIIETRNKDKVDTEL